MSMMAQCTNATKPPSTLSNATMDRVEADKTPAEEWQDSLNATCNRLSTQYLNLLRAASSASASEEGRQDPRGGGGVMTSLSEPAPPLAADAALSELQTQLAVQNIVVATTKLLDLIRTLQLSILLMDEDTIAAEEAHHVRETEIQTQRAREEAAELDMELWKLKNAATRQQ